MLSVRRFSPEIRARESGQADFLAGHILEISDDGSKGYIQTEDCEPPDHEHIHPCSRQKQLRFDNQHNTGIRQRR